MNLVQGGLFSDSEIGYQPKKIEMTLFTNPSQEKFFKETGQPCFFDDGKLINPEYLAWCERRLDHCGTTN